MDIPKSYEAGKAESKWYEYWQNRGYFHSEPDEREPYTIVIPPPNVTGVLHMGHMLNNTIQDVLIRRARLLGKNACWVPGTDHASIATEAKVVQKLKSEGIDKRDIGREEFLKHAWEWTEKYGGTIFKQLKRLGASCDWERERFTMEDDLSDAVKEVFIDLYRKGHIYRGVRMVNWDPDAQTALSDEEVIHKEVNSKLYYLDYKLEDGSGIITIATTRPETILGDTGICVNPNDERYKDLIGKKAIVPLIDRPVPIVADDYVDPEFGTGCLKVTPAHDINDYEIGLRHNLESIDVFNDDGTLSEAAQLYVGRDRFEVRDAINEELKEKGFLQKVEHLNNKVGFSERTNAVIEPKLSLQWFLDMKEMAKPALDKVMDDSIQFHPANTKNTYRHWMENIKDWCISRQLWWGHRIPAYYYGKGTKDYVIADGVEDALKLAKEKSGNQSLTAADIRQDEDVLDTWFSSWLWPISVFDGFKDPENKEIQYYYPTNDLVTAPEIMFFWVARMIMAGYEYLDDQPFKNVYYTGIVRDKEGRKMSKSLGNSPDPIELIEKYGADGVRVGMLFSSPAGNDLLFDESLCEQGRNFSNKIWNAFRLIKSWEIDENKAETETEIQANQWFNDVLSEKLEEINQNYDKFRISDVLMSTYKLIWDEFCSWYLEMIKPAFGEKMSATTYANCISILEDLLRILHPFMPFISEEIWHLIKERGEDECLIIDRWPEKDKFPSSKKDFKGMKDWVIALRKIRKDKQIPFKEAMELKLIDPKGKGDFDHLVMKLCNLSTLERVDEKVENSLSFVISDKEFFIPAGDNVDVEQEKARIQEEIAYQEGFLKSVQKKLANDSFVKNAPEQVVSMEKKKESDAQTKLDLLKKQLAAL
ncbi:MAG: valine--tRNA ligase [Flavobacteriales bacterium]|nr:valine--tRNA ligase [Flavobacteriales bacterium]